MPHFVALVRYTQQGIAKIKESPSRLDATKKEALHACNESRFADPCAHRSTSDLMVVSITSSNIDSISLSSSVIVTPAAFSRLPCPCACEFA